MIVFLNGKFVPEEQALVSVFDRSFLYGDGLFETMLLVNGVPFRWEQHLERFERGAVFLGISVPFGLAKLRAAAGELIFQNRTHDGLLRLSLSRGVGVRGYSPRGANFPTLVMTLHPLADSEAQNLKQWHLRIASFRLAANEPLAQFKNCNKLTQVMARAEVERLGADEALLTNSDGFVVEGATSNLFWIQQEIVFTPPLSSGILSGVTRLVILDLCRELGLEVREANITRDELLQAEGIFLSLSSFGIVEAVTLDQQPLKLSPLTQRLHTAYLAVILREVGERDR
jgi:branched-chain amino acid aminotransferase